MSSLHELVHVGDAACATNTSSTSSVQSLGRTAVRIVGAIPACEPVPLETGGAAALARVRPPTMPSPATGRVAVAMRMDPRAWPAARAALTMLMEALDGRRSITQIASVAVPTISELISQRMDARRRNGQSGASTLGRVHVQFVRPDAIEVTGTCTRGGRVHAIAARMEHIPVRVAGTVPGAPRALEPRWMVVAFTTM